MFNVEINMPQGHNYVDIDGNACEMYCGLAHKIKEKVTISVQDGAVCVEAYGLCMRASGENAASYEWKLAEVEKKQIFLNVDDEIDDPELKAYLDEENNLDILRLVTEKTANGENCLFSLTEKVSSKTHGDYEISYSMTYDAVGQTVRLDYTSTKEKTYEEGISGSIFNEGITSWMKYFTIDELIAFDFCNTPFETMMRKIAVYCEQEQLEVTFEQVDYGIPGHSIDVPCLVVETDRFKVVFDLCGGIKEVHVAEEIMDTSYYIESQGKKYVIGDIIRQVQSEGKYFIHGYGAENIWHRYYGTDSKYIYGCGFNF